MLFGNIPNPKSEVRATKRHKSHKRSAASVLFALLAPSRGPDFGFRISRAALAALLLLGGLRPALAQTNTPSNRYLLVVETSTATKPRRNAINSVISDLLASGMHQQLHPGDTLGLWTYSDELFAGRFPLQYWSEQERGHVLEHVLTFLNQQPFDRDAYLSTVLPALQGLIRTSPYLTVILLTDGEESMRGTPFDSQINDAYKAWRERQQRNHMPFVTILRARHGTVTDYSVTPAPWAVEVPALPPELAVVKTAAPPAQAAPAKPAAPAVPALVFHGQDPSPSSVDTPYSAPKHPATPALSATQAEASAKVAGTRSTVSPSTLPAPDKAASMAAPGDGRTPGPSTAPNAPVLLAKAEPSRYQLPGAVPVSKSPSAAVPGPASPPPSASAPAQRGLGSTLAVVIHRKDFWVAVLVLVASLSGLVLLVARRARSTSQVSLITRSLERQQK